MSLLETASPGLLHKQAQTANKRIRVLIVDDSVVIRRLVTHALEQDSALEVVGSAANGKMALERIPLLKPDVITLDIEMPEMDGLATLREVSRLYPQIRVIMFSTLTAHGAAATVEALSLGASDYVTKASNAGSLDRSMDRLHSELIPKIKQFFSFQSNNKPDSPLPRSAPRPAPPVMTAAPKLSRTERRVLAIGSSTGGPNALAAVLKDLGKNFSLPILIVQHMPPMFTRLLAERLSATSGLRVEEARDGSSVEAGVALIAPGDYHMEVRATSSGVVTVLNQNAPEHSCRPAVDVLFRSVAQVYGGSAIALVLTGMGYDGAIGATDLQKRGAYIIAQDEASSVVWGMTGAVVKAGAAHAEVSLDGAAAEILRQL